MPDSARRARLFANDATANTVTKITAQGSGDASFGVIYFGTGTTTGNDNNAVTDSNITAAGANLPLNGVYSFGSSVDRQQRQRDHRQQHFGLLQRFKRVERSEHQ
ncbi:MAG: hypothetical protein IPJ30_25640 [Acidobacteria bacterium]|nr:hypothetical protein [Acidobacteriota bacterium]